MKFSFDEESKKVFGLPCWENQDFVVRARVLPGGVLRLVVNRKIRGVELLDGPSITVDLNGNASLGSMKGTRRRTTDD